ncbi:MAG: hypothetical protein LBS08_05980 [Candidatus Symbiothrix sp.]|jgi:phage-related protein|nr:hypothetical protein [Candidatus Symbiothrix sp.]
MNSNKIIVIIVIVIILCFILLGCLLTWRIDCIILQSANNETELKLARDSLINANTLTFLVTLIVGLLASLLVFRIDKIDRLVNENKELKSTIENTLTDYLSKTVKFNIFLTYIENIHYMVNMIANVTSIIELHNSTDFRQVGVLCSRIDPIMYKITESLEHNRLCLSKESRTEKEILCTFTDEIVSLLEKVSPIIRNTGSLIFKNIDDIFSQMHRIQKRIKDIDK